MLWQEYNYLNKWKLIFYIRHNYICQAGIELETVKFQSYIVPLPRIINNILKQLAYTLASQSGDISTAISLECPGNLGSTVIILSRTDSLAWLVTPQRSKVRSTMMTETGFEQFWKKIYYIEKHKTQLNKQNKLNIWNIWFHKTSDCRHNGYGFDFHYKIISIFSF